MGKGLAIVGTSSSCGKTFIVTLICAYMKKIGVRVAPFKPQNMSLNSYPAVDGGEIALAQAMQAYAAGTEPLTAMNPVLIKPFGNRSEIILRGKPLSITTFSVYWRNILDTAWKEVVKAFDELARSHDSVIVEGAGCCAEPNFVDRDISNLRIAVEKRLPAVLVVDIERGGAFASVVGVLNTLPPSLRERIKGVIINKFVGDEKILEPAIEWLEERTGLRVLGVVPRIDVSLWPEDSMELKPFGDGSLDVALIAYPTISNFGDVEPLKLEPDVRLRIVRSCNELGEPDLVILPGCRSSFTALSWIKRVGLDRCLSKLLGSTVVLAICCGAQLAASRIVDIYGVEAGVPTHAEGLGIANYVVMYGLRKVVSHSIAVPRVSELEDVGMIRGYEIRRGFVSEWRGEEPALEIISRNGIAVAEPDGIARGKVFATHIHDALSNPGFRARVLNEARRLRGLPPRYTGGGWRTLLEINISRALEIFEKSVDVDSILELAL